VIDDQARARAGLSARPPARAVKPGRCGGPGRAIHCRLARGGMLIALHDVARYYQMGDERIAALNAE
jgi:hypothetical protein